MKQWFLAAATLTDSFGEVGLPMNDGFPDFSGKPVFVNFASSSESHQLLADPRLEK